MFLLSAALGVALISCNAPDRVTHTVGVGAGKYDRLGGGSSFDATTYYYETAVGIPLGRVDVVPRHVLRQAAEEVIFLRERVTALESALADATKPVVDKSEVALHDHESEGEPENQWIAWLDRALFLALGGGALYGGQKGAPVAQRVWKSRGTGKG